MKAQFYIKPIATPAVAAKEVKHSVSANKRININDYVLDWQKQDDCYLLYYETSNVVYVFIIESIADLQGVAYFLEDVINAT